MHLNLFYLVEMFFVSITDGLINDLTAISRYFVISCYFQRIFCLFHWNVILQLLGILGALFRFPAKSRSYSCRE